MGGEGKGLLKLGRGAMLDVVIPDLGGGASGWRRGGIEATLPGGYVGEDGTESTFFSGLLRCKVSPELGGQGKPDWVLGPQAATVAISGVAPHSIKYALTLQRSYEMHEKRRGVFGKVWPVHKTAHLCCLC